MMVEGVGATAPPRVLVQMRQQVLDKLIQEGIRREQARGYGRSKGKWKQGLIPHATIRGLVGEEACCEWLRRAIGLSESILGVDLTDRPGGDDGKDIELLEKRIQVKCRKRYSGLHHVRRLDDRRRTVPIESDIVAFTTWEQDQIAAPFNLTVSVDGWLSRVDCMSQSLAPGRVSGSKHYNLEVPDDRLQPLEELIDTFRAVIERAS